MPVYPCYLALPVGTTGQTSLKISHKNLHSKFTNSILEKHWEIHHWNFFFECGADFELTSLTEIRNFTRFREFGARGLASRRPMNRLWGHTSAHRSERRCSPSLRALPWRLFNPPPLHPPATQGLIARALWDRVCRLNTGEIQLADVWGWATPDSLTAAGLTKSAETCRIGSRDYLFGINGAWIALVENTFRVF